jgi:hypothetical protein
VLDVQHNQNATRHAYRQAGNVDEGISLVFKQISGGDFQIIFEHVFLQPA